MIVNISFKQTKQKVIDDYTKTLRGWANKDVSWANIHKVMNKDNIQYSCYAWRNGVKIPKTFKRDKQNCIILDIDDGITIQAIQKMFKKYTYIIGTTKSHQQDKKGLVCDRFRMVIPCINVPEEDDVYFRALELIAPFNDKQTLIKTASFLGNSKSIVIRNDGDILDLHKAGVLAAEQLKEEYLEKVVIDKDFINYTGGNNIEDVKSQLTVDIVKDILDSVGIEVVGNKCKLREEERTHSAKIYPSGYIKDFGCSDSSGDIFKILQDKEGMSFREAISYVRNFI